MMYHLFQNMSRICCLIFVLILVGWGCSSDVHRSEIASEPFYFITHGRVFEIDLQTMDIELVTRFHSAAPTVARAPDGLYWARTDEKGLAVYNPVEGKLEATVMLPYRPYNHIITPGGRAYVTHHTVTAGGFSVSVIDTYRKKLIKQIQPISGLRTDLAYGDGFVYLATEGVGSDVYLHLYEIDTRNDRRQEIYREPKSNFSWRVSVHGNALVVCRVYRSAPADSTRMLVLDRSTKKVLQNVNADELPGIKILGRMVFVHEQGFLPYSLPEGRYGIAVLDTEGLRIQDLLPVTGKVYRIIGVRENLLIYMDHPLGSGKRGSSLFFYDMDQRKEVKMIDVLEHLEFE